MIKNKIQKEDLLGLAVAKLAKKKGFNWKCTETFTEKHSTLSRPSQSLLQKWLRDTQNIFMYVGLDHLFSPGTYSIFTSIKDSYSGEIISRGLANKFFNNHKTHKSAIEIGLKHALKLID